VDLQDNARTDQKNLGCGSEINWHQTKSKKLRSLACMLEQED
jgi:hypothetical protein